MKDSHFAIADGINVHVRRAAASEVIDLRHRVLRQGLPRTDARFADDDLPTSGHFGAFVGEVAICCATLHLNQWEGAPAYQLRGMATDPIYRGKGLGSAVLQLAEMTMTADRRILQLWCNAREPAVHFYEIMGWKIISERFDIPTAGPHFQMSKRIA